MNDEKLNLYVIVVPIILAIVLMVGFSIFNTYDRYYMPLEHSPSLNYNYTTAVQTIGDNCYYQGRQYGCNRNLSELLEEEENE